MLNALPTDKKEILLIAQNSYYDCRFILEYLQNVQPIVKSVRFSHFKATYYNPQAKNKINIIVKDSYNLIPMPLRDFGKCFEFDVNKEVMPYGVYTYENVNMGAVSIQSALGLLKDDDKTHKKFNDIYAKGNDRFIKAFQVFKVLIDNVDKLVTPMELTDEVLNTQFYDKVDDYKTL